MKYLVGIYNTCSYEYNVNASSDKEAREIADKLHNNPKTKDMPTSYWDCYVGADDSK